MTSRPGCVGRAAWGELEAVVAADEAGVGVTVADELIEGADADTDVPGMSAAVFSRPRWAAAGRSRP